MSEHNESQAPKKLSLQDAIKQKLAQKKQAGSGGASLTGSTDTKKLTSQQTKKTNNQRRRMGV
ncbi:hypothetical protein [Peribacillus acanthi]|uniref:hypothetical protein n=1 Tax=Peribacillus acanthi TaxID=2171554 RepID=UPI000D3E1A3F|nr:hypothetical protein [Peribacillus acanthi]